MSDHRGPSVVSRRRFLGTLGAMGIVSVVSVACQQSPPASPTAPAQPGATPKSASTAAPQATAAPAAAGKTSVSFTSQGNKAELAMFDRIFDEFEKQTPQIKIDRKYDTTLSWPKVINELRTGTASDVMRTNDDDVFLLLSADVIASLDDYVHHNLKQSDYLPPTFKTRVGPGGEIGGALVGTAPTVMFYNVDLLTKAGIKPPTDWDKDNWTIDQLEENMQKLTQKASGRTNVYGWAEPYWWLQVALWNEGVPIYNTDQTKAELATPEGIAITQRMQSWYKQGWAVPPGENQTELFNGGFLAMTFQDMGFSSSIKKNVKWDVGPAPKGKAHDGAFHNDRVFAIPKSSKVRDDAWQVLTFWFGQSEDGNTGGQAEIARNDWGVPTLIKAADGPLFSDPKKLPPHHSVYMQGASKGWPIPDNPMGEQFQVIFRNIDSLKTGKQSPEDFLKSAEATLDQVIEQTGWNASHNTRGWRMEGILDKSGRGKIS